MRGFLFGPKRTRPKHRPRRSKGLYASVAKRAKLKDTKTPHLNIERHLFPLIGNRSPN